VDKVLAKRDQLHNLRQRVKEIEQKQNDNNTDTVTTLLLQDEFERLCRSVEQLVKQLRHEEESIGVGPDLPLTHSAARLDQYKSFYKAQLSARVLKSGIRSRIVEYKFEHEKLERSYRHQVNRESSS
jgi:hypothetical protein